MKKMNFKKGFTLIELLVVVAIIGILASVVLASLNSARNKGKDAAIQAQLSNMRGQAELYYSTNGTYGFNSGAAGAALGVANGVTILPGTSCTANHANAPGTTMFGTASTSSGLQQLIFGACSSGATTINAAVDTAASTTVGAKAWAVEANGVSANAWFCVDSSGQSKSYSQAGAPTIAVTGTSAICQ